MLTLATDSAMRDLESRGLFREAAAIRASCWCRDVEPDVGRAIREAEADGDWELWFRLQASAVRPRPASSKR